MSRQLIATLISMALVSPALANNGLKQRVEQLEAIVGGLTSGDYSVSVDCAAGQKITDALVNAPRSAKVTITVNGTCTEDVVIERDDVIIKGPTSGAPSATVVGQFDIITSSRIELSDLTVRDSNEIGILAARGTSLRLRNMSVSGHANSAVFALRHSFIRFDNVTATGGAASNYFGTVVANDGSTLRVLNSSFTSTTTGGEGPAIGLFRMSHARFDEGNTIANTNVNSNPSQALAIQMTSTSNIRVQRAGNTVTGNVSIFGNSAGDFRGVSLTGQFRVSSASHAVMFTGTTFNGNVFVDRRSLFDSFGGSSVTGSLTCTGDSAASGTGNVVGGVAGCTTF